MLPMSPMRLASALLPSTRFEAKGWPFSIPSRTPFSTVSLTCYSCLATRLSFATSMMFLAYFIITIFVLKEQSSLLCWDTKSLVNSSRSELDVVSFSLRRPSSWGRLDGSLLKCVLNYYSFAIAVLMRLWFGDLACKEFINEVSLCSCLLDEVDGLTVLRVLNVFDI